MDSKPSEPESTPPSPGEAVEDLGATRVVPPAEAHPDTALVSGVPTSVVPPHTPSVSSNFGNFRLLRKLGQGAMAAVYKARQINPERDVALKVLFKHVADNPKLLERFYREARVLGQLDHPNIVRGYAVGEHAGLHYCAMEFVDGQSLQSWLNRLGRLGVADTLHIALACARALEYAHGRGLIHRDIKPDNVLITTDGTVKLADLGMVKQLDEDLSLTQTGHGVGTPWYMPLEQARNAKETDARSDIYALGCTLYHALTGRPPFASLTMVDLIREKQIGTFPPARQFNPEVPERLDLILAKMVAKHPRHRYPNCTELIQDFEALGLAGPVLSFLSAAEAGPVAPMQETSEAVIPAPPPSSPEVPADEWYVRYKKPNGLVVLRRLTTAEVLRRLQAGEISPKARASREAGKGFRALGTYREFASAVLPQVARSGADRQTVRYRSLYKKIEEQERQRQAEEEEPEQGNYVYWMELALKFGLPIVGIVIIILFLRWLVSVIQ
jgi:tRNA A-37 threonylcarbamoyl transferase component Bud32